MRLYTDYFNNLLLDEAYHNEREQAEECLSLLNMIVESMIERKLPYAEKKLFSRGLVITEAEMKLLISTPPRMRELGEIDLLLPLQAETAFSHIRSRSSRTENREWCPFSVLKETFSLDDFEMFVVILTFASSTSMIYSRMFGFLQDDITKLSPTVGLAEALYNLSTDKKRSSFREYFEEGSKLKKYILDSRKGNASLSTPLRMRPRMIGFLSGRSETFVSSNGLVTSLSRGYEDYPFYPRFRAQISGEQPLRAVCVSTSNNYNIEELLGKIVCDTSTTVLKLNAQLLSLSDTLEAEDAVKDIMTEMRLRRILVWIDGFSKALLENPQIVIYIKMLMAENRDSVLIFSGEEDLHDDFGRLEIGTVSIDSLSTSDRKKAWEYYTEKHAGGLAMSADISFDDLSDCYAFSPASISKIIQQAVVLTRAEQKKEIERGTLMSVIFSYNKANFGTNATAINAIYNWDDIEMEDSQKQVLLTACRRFKIKNRVCESYGLERKSAYGNGVSVLLYGPPGTGKTMAAQVVANEVGLELFRVDLSQISSKYIGETQKNIGAIFDEASRCNVVLFFDEADSLFAKRTQVNDSNDKHANAETAYLLQRIEDYSGICVLATNFYNNFDPAFVRRITYAVRLSNPNEEVRLRLWRNILPDSVPKAEDLDLAFFAKEFEISGSNIKAILMSATYMAAAEGSKLSNRHIVKAIKYEFEKMGKIVNAMDFGMYGLFLDM